MLSHQRELLVARICSGSIRWQEYLFKPNTKEQEYIGWEIYDEVFRQSELEGLYTDDELYSFLLEEHLWDEEKEKMFMGIPKDIEEFKVKLFQLTFKSNERAVARKALGIAKAKYLSLLGERHAYDHLSCAGAASMARSRFLISGSLHSKNDKEVIGDEVLEKAVQALQGLRIDEEEYRELARTEPWRSLWACRKSSTGIFGVPVVDYSDEQRAIVAWSTLYDNVFQHPECPADDVIKDDDMLDGWLIAQRREADKRKAKKEGEELIGNEKVRNSQEIFLVADNPEDARKVMDLNDPHAKAVQKLRFKHLKEKGELNEGEMPDTRQRVNMELTQLLSRSNASNKS